MKRNLGTGEKGTEIKVSAFVNFMVDCLKKKKKMMMMKSTV